MLKECERLLEAECGGKAFLVPSCTAALELSCRMVLNPGDEVIMPSWSHPSAASAVILAGGSPVFVDVNEDLNIDVCRIVEAITHKTKAILPVHYAGVVCDMQSINDIAASYGLYVIEDAAQAIGNWKVSGDFGCLSFHEKKNVQVGQGGALIVRNQDFIDQVSVYQSMGTNRFKKPNWDWVGLGSSYLMSERLAELLHVELLKLPKITKSRQERWDYFNSMPTMLDVEKATKRGNGHLFWFFVENKWDYLEAKGSELKATSHFDALHMTIPGRKYGRVGGHITRATKAMRMLVKFDTNVPKTSAERGRIQEAA